MNKRAAALLADIQEVGLHLPPPSFIFPAPDNRKYIRTGYVKATEETEKMEIAGLPCGVAKETETEVHVFVFVEGKTAGPFTLKPCEVTS